uniref:Semialdehyde dehydrogenase dimerisation domain-containing protein n=1 Tax=Quercus lobata TaxID=97700 RepID=A0A7N2L6V0_QUELO
MWDRIRCRAGGRACGGSTNGYSGMETARDILKNAPGVVVIDDRVSNHFPTSLEVSNKDDVAVGRIRRDVSQEGNNGLDIFVCGDQIRKGAALNAVLIAEMLL